MREDGRSAEFPNTYHVMFTEWELLEAVFPDHGPGFTDATRNALFVNLQPDNSLIHLVFGKNTNYNLPAFIFKPQIHG